MPRPIRATLADLPPAVAAAVQAARALPEEGRRIVLQAGGGRTSALDWGPVDGRPLLLVHGVTSSARTYWRVGPGLAAAGWHAIAPDLPGHGRTGGGADGRGFRFAETAVTLAALARAAFPVAEVADRLAVVGHSWGAVLTASLPAAGLRPGRLVLLDPPVMDLAACRAMMEDPTERPAPTFEAALATITAANPDWPEGDRAVKAESLTEFAPEAAEAVLLGNGDWDGGLAALAEPAARGIPTWVVRGEDATGSLTPAASLPAYIALIGADRVLTVAGGPHSLQRSHVAATLVALLRALEA